MGWENLFTQHCLAWRGHKETCYLYQFSGMECFSAAFNRLITELGSIRYVPGSNYQLQLLAPLRSFGDKQNKTTNKTTDCHL